MLLTSSSMTIFVVAVSDMGNVMMALEFHLLGVRLQKRKFSQMKVGRGTGAWEASC